MIEIGHLAERPHVAGVACVGEDLGRTVPAPSREGDMEARDQAVAGAPERAQSGGADGGIVGGPVDQAVVIRVGQHLLFEVGKQPDEDAASDKVAVGREQGIWPAILSRHSVRDRFRDRSHNWRGPGRAA